MARPYLNVAAYRFFDCADLTGRRDRLWAHGQAHGIKGTVLLAPEGINLFISAPPQAACSWLESLRQEPGLADIEVKFSESDQCEFERWRVRIKKEIITMREPALRPQDGRAPSVDAKTLSRWLDQGRDDDGRPVRMVDTRNGFEVEAGSFEQAIDLNIRSFGDFPQAIAQQRQALEGARIVTFCTGGIRCEKAALHMRARAFEHVVQLEGGVLRYFEEVGARHWHGELFVFDQRVGVGPDLAPTYGRAREPVALTSTANSADTQL